MEQRETMGEPGSQVQARRGTYRAWQADRLEAMWRVNSDRLRRGDIAIDPLIHRPEDDDRLCLTLMAWIPPPLHPAIQAVQASLQSRSAHFVYPPVSLHFTIRGIYDYGEKYPRIEADNFAIADILGKMIRRLRPFVIDFAGLGVNRSAVYVQGLYDDPDIGQFRRAIAEELASFLVAPLPTLDVEVDFVWINIVRFTHPHVRPLVDEVARLRDHLFGRVVIRELELAEIDKFCRPGKSRTYRTYRIPG